MKNAPEEPGAGFGRPLAVGGDLGRLSRRDFKAAEARHRQSLFFSIAVVFLAMIPIDAYIVGRFDPWLVLVQVAWSAIFVTASILTRRYGSFATDKLDLTLSVTSSVFFVLEVMLTGGSQSWLLPWCLVMPVAVSLVARTRIRDAVLSSAICGISTIAFVSAGHADRRSLVAWGLLVFSTTFVSISSSLLQARVSKTVTSLGRSRRKLDYRRAQSSRERAEARRLELVGRLAAGVAHEVNNPLAVVKANLSFARNEVRSRIQEPWCATVVESLVEAAGGVERIRLLIRDLAEFSPERTMATEECEPQELVADAVDLIRAGTSVMIVTETTSALPAVRVVRPQLVQVLRSLLHNAVDAVEGLPTDQVRRVVIRASGNPLGVQIEVEDSGAGLSRDVLPRLFEPFFSTKPVGSGKGLNLAKSREQVLRSGGSISAENLPSGGARFTVRLPAAGIHTESTVMV